MVKLSKGKLTLFVPQSVPQKIGFKVNEIRYFSILILKSVPQI